MARLDEIKDAAHNLSIDDLEALVNILKHDLTERRKAPHTRSAEIATAAATANTAKKKNSKSIDVDDILDQFGDDV